jgi:hypothetical protein
MTIENILKFIDLCFYVFFIHIIIFFYQILKNNFFKKFIKIKIKNIWKKNLKLNLKILYLDIIRLSKKKILFKKILIRVTKIL